MKSAKASPRKVAPKRKATNDDDDEDTKQITKTATKKVKKEHSPELFSFDGDAVSAVFGGDNDEEASMMREEEV